MKNFSIFIKQYVAQGKTGVAALLIIVIAFLISVLGYLITPDVTSNANTMCLPVALKKPCFSGTFIKVKLNNKPAPHTFFYTMLWGKDVQYKLIPINSYLLKDKEIIINEYTGDSDATGKFTYAISMCRILYGVEPIESSNGKLLVDLPVGRSWVAIEEVKQQVLQQIVKRTFWLGTDNYGRDLLSRLLIGTRVTLSVGFISVFIAIVIGITLGAIAGYFRGKIDDFLMWVINVVWSIPTILLVIAITLALGKGFWQVFVAVGLTMWVDVARLVRGKIFSLREQEFVQAAQVLGYSSRRIIFKHILPNITGPVIVIACSNFASAILLESGLSFLGVGVQPPVPSWGRMLKESYGYITMDAAYMAFLPGICIMLLVMAFGLVGVSLEKMWSRRA